VNTAVPSNSFGLSPKWMCIEGGKVPPLVRLRSSSWTGSPVFSALTTKLCGFPLITKDTGDRPANSPLIEIEAPGGWVDTVSVSFSLTTFGTLTETQLLDAKASTAINGMVLPRLVIGRSGIWGSGLSMALGLFLENQFRIMPRTDSPW
jgi:hypothetical protein